MAQVNCVYDGTVCYVDNSDFDTSAVFTLSPNYDPEFLTPSSCSEGCVEAGPEYIIVGITNNKTCLCGKSGTGEWCIFNACLGHLQRGIAFSISIDLVAVDRSNCWMNCSDDSPCGGYSGFFSVYEPASSVPKDISFDLMLVSGIHISRFPLIWIHFLCRTIQWLQRSSRSPTSTCMEPLPFSMSNQLKTLLPPKLVQDLSQPRLTFCCPLQSTCQESIVFHVRTCL